MKFHRIAKPLRSQFEMAPFACVFFLLVMFIMLGSITYVPGVRIEMPVAEPFAGMSEPGVTVAVDRSGRYFFNSQLHDADGIKTNLMNVVKHSRQPPTLIIQADIAVTQEQLIRLMSIAREAGITNAWAAMQPRERDSAADKPSTIQP